MVTETVLRSVGQGRERSWGQEDRGTEGQTELRILSACSWMLKCLRLSFQLTGATGESYEWTATIGEDWEDSPDGQWCGHGPVCKDVSTCLVQSGT